MVDKDDIVNESKSVSIQTDSYECDHCATNLHKVKYMELLEKEHYELKNHDTVA